MPSDSLQTAITQLSQDIQSLAEAIDTGPHWSSLGSFAAAAAAAMVSVFTYRFSRIRPTEDHTVEFVATNTGPLAVILDELSIEPEIALSDKEFHFGGDRKLPLPIILGPNESVRVKLTAPITVAPMHESLLSIRRTIFLETSLEGPPLKVKLPLVKASKTDQNSCPD